MIGGGGFFFFIIVGLFGINLDGILGGSDNFYVFVIFVIGLFFFGVIVIVIGICWFGFKWLLFEDDIIFCKVELEEFIVKF